MTGSPTTGGPSVARPIIATWLGTVPYLQALALQKSLVASRQAGEIPDTVLLLEHEHVFTLGRRADASHVLADEGTLASLHATVIETDRGGEATYHGPGQLVVYPVISLREAGLGPVAYVRLLEEVVISTLHDYGIHGHRVVGKTGVWVGGDPGPKIAPGQAPSGAKIAAIGVRVSDGVASHGFALNVSTDLSYFGYIIPCGMPSLNVTSISSLGRRPFDVREAATRVGGHLAQLLGRKVEWSPPAGITQRAKASLG